MGFHRRVGAVAVVLAAALAGAGSALAATPVPGYEEQVVASTGTAIAIDFAPDGRLFVGEKKGLLKVVDPNGTIKTVYDLRSHVNSGTDRGLTGVAVDSAFASNHYVYLLYTYESNPQNTSGPKTTRLTRVQVNPDDTLVNPSNPETLIIGSYQPNFLAEACPPPANNIDCIPADGLSHVGGTVLSAPDGTLYVGTGDAMYAANNNPDPFRPLDQTSYAGKILHISRSGQGLPGHPFCPTDTNLADACTKVFAMGFRNPFRFSFDSKGGLWVGDVGEATWEELDHGVPGGNYGWPCYEGPDHFAPRATDSRCTALYAKEGTSSAAKQPIFDYNHNGGGGVILVGPEYHGSAYPASFQGSVFFGDINDGFLDYLQINSDGTAGTRQHFADGYGGVDMRVGPDGLLYTANFFNITRFAVAPGNRPPSAKISAAPTAGPAPLTVAFDGSGSSDPDGDPLTYTWNFGDGSPASNAVNPSHSYAAGTYTASLTVQDTGGLTNTTTVTIKSGVQPPTLTVSGPSTYRDGTPVTLTASAHDSTGTDISSTVQWHIELHHNDHIHVIGDQTGSSATWTPVRDHDTDGHYEVTVTATDKNGVSTQKIVSLYGETAPVDLEVDPAGGTGTVSYGSVTYPWPLQRVSVIGFQTIVAASSSITYNGQTIPFANWSDGGAQAHTVTVPPGGLSLVARYSFDTTPPNTTITNAQSTYFSANVQFTFKSTEPGTFECKVDNDIWFICASPYTTRKLPSGQHVFQVRAIDQAGNVDPTPARAQFQVNPLL